MLHKRCDIKTLLDEAIRRERGERDLLGDTDPGRISHITKIDAYQEIRDAIFDERLAE